MSSFRASKITKEMLFMVSEAIREGGAFVKESSRSFILKCPHCGKDKLYFEKNEGYFKCFSGSCGNSGSYVKLFSQIRNITIQQAKQELEGGDTPHSKPLIDITLVDESSQIVEEQPIDLPHHFVSLRQPESIDGRAYCLKRGIPTEIAEHYGVTYSPLYRRVVFPIKNEDGLTMGYQARAIDPVEKSARMRNNPGFKKGQFFMFMDQSYESEHLIVAEGPVDAIKFHKCGGNIASLGKDLTHTQLDILINSKAKKIYWALDDDAEDLVPEYARLIGKPCSIIRLSDKVKSRILSTGKEKADFGECTMEECEEMFNNAEPIYGKISIKLV